MAASSPTPHRAPRAVTRVRLENYRSIAACDVRLGRVNALVGRNGAGKSNFLDALRLVAEGLRDPFDQAIHERGGVQQIGRRSGGHPMHFAIRLDLALGDGRPAWFSFRVGDRKNGDYAITHEACEVGAGLLGGAERFEIQNGVVKAWPDGSPPPVAPDRLYLQRAGAHPTFRAVFDHLSGMAFYNIQPQRLREQQAQDRGDLLARDGWNAAAIIRRLAARDASAFERVKEYMGKVVPGLQGMERKAYGSQEGIEFLQQVEGADRPWRFPAHNMSDGTLRALAVLLALFQRNETGPIPLTGIEEPEIALHPAASGVLVDAMVEASEHTQVLITSHSPDLLTNEPGLPPEAIIAVESDHGRTLLAPLSAGDQERLRLQLFTAGELLQQDMLRPDLALARPTAAQMRLFAPLSG